MKTTIDIEITDINIEKDNWWGMWYDFNYTVLINWKTIKWDYSSDYSWYNIDNFKKMLENWLAMQYVFEKLWESFYDEFCEDE